MLCNRRLAMRRPHLFCTLSTRTAWMRPRRRHPGHFHLPGPYHRLSSTDSSVAKRETEVPGVSNPSGTLDAISKAVISMIAPGGAELRSVLSNGALRPTTRERKQRLSLAWWRFSGVEIPGRKAFLTTGPAMQTCKSLQEAAHPSWDGTSPPE